MWGTWARTMRTECDGTMDSSQQPLEGQEESRHQYCAEQQELNIFLQCQKYQMVFKQGNYILGQNSVAKTACDTQKKVKGWSAKFVQYRKIQTRPEQKQFFCLKLFTKKLETEFKSHRPGLQFVWYWTIETKVVLYPNWGFRHHPQIPLLINEAVS